MMRTPASSGDVFPCRDAAGLVGHRHVQGDEVGARQQLVQLDLLDTHFLGAFSREEGVVGDDMHAKANRLLADDAADIAGADNTERLAGDFNTMNFDFSHLPAWVEASACGSWRATANIRAMACSAVVIELPKGVFITMIPRLEAAGISNIVDTDTGAADDLEVGRSGDQLFRRLGGRADGEDHRSCR